MAGANSWRTNIDAPDWMRDVEKRIMHEERRPFIGQPSDLMGPGLAPFAVETQDWNDDALAGNGFWWSGPGAQSTPNGVINQDWWMGQTIGNEDGFGLQWCQIYRPITDPIDQAIMPTIRWIRRFFDPGAGGLRTYSAWVQDGGGGGACPDIAWTPLNFVNGWENYGSGYAEAAYCRVGGIVHLRGLVRNGATGAIATLPEGVRPSTRSIWTGGSASVGPQSAGTAHTHSPGTNRVDVLPDGSILYIAPSTGYVDLSQIIFPAAGCGLGEGPAPSNGMVVAPSWKRIGTNVITTDGSYATGFQNVGSITIPEAHWVTGRIFRAYWNGNLVADTGGNYTLFFLRYGLGASNGISSQQMVEMVLDARVASRRQGLTAVGETPPWPLPGAVSGSAYNVVAVIQGGGGGSRHYASAEAPCVLHLDAFY